MSDNFSKWRDPPFSAADHVHRRDHMATAREIVDRLGPAASGCAIGHHVEAQAAWDDAAAEFWLHVYEAVIRIRPTECPESPGVRHRPARSG